MFCRNALVEKAITAEPDQTIADALRLLEKHGIRMLPVVDAGGRLAGGFNFTLVLSNLLPGPVTVETHGLLDANLRLDYLVDTDDQVRRLVELLPVKLAEIMEREPTVVHPDTPVWEGIRRLFQPGSPISIVEPDTRSFLGLLSVQSVMCELARLAGECNRSRSP